MLLSSVCFSVPAAWLLDAESVGCQSSTSHEKKYLHDYSMDSGDVNDLLGPQRMNPADFCDP